jgi:hypothetical protein
MTKLPEPTYSNPQAGRYFDGYTTAQMKAYGEACRRAAIAECIEITDQWGPLGQHFAQTLKELK